ncbi:uncharacterized protein LOC130934725 [Arachis stenosperma]|uniref:uncharacterized protein LOC130934725 n=1 Tax=Arachis stenosperma TaxID=217475 RepID=UPI0025AC698A|nr:uncharacterized protein LOC130934725 [Arachis stenosperma]
MLQQLFVKKGKEAQTQLAAEDQFSQWRVAAVKKIREGISKMRVTHYDRRASVFVVKELNPFEGWSQGSFRIWLSAGTCDCDLFQSLNFSCHHALAACTATSVEWGTYIHPIKQEVMFKVYEAKLPPILDKKLWLEWYGTLLHPNPSIRRGATGRSIFTRFRIEMDKGKCQEKAI